MLPVQQGRARMRSSAITGPLTGLFLLQPAFDKASFFDKAMRENKKASSVRDARIDIPDRTDEPLGQVRIPASAPADSKKARVRHVPEYLVGRLRLCHHPPVAVPSL